MAFVIEKTWYYYGKSNCKELVGNGQEFSSRSEAYKWIKPLYDAVYVLSDGEYSRPHYRVLDASKSNAKRLLRELV